MTPSRYTDPITTHAIYKCSAFERLNVQQRWDAENQEGYVEIVSELIPICANLRIVNVAIDFTIHFCIMIIEIPQNKSPFRNQTTPKRTLIRANEITQHD